MPAIAKAGEKTALLDASSPVKGDLCATLQLLFTSSAGLFADGWDLQVINLVLAILSSLYPDNLTVAGKSFAASLTLAGVVIGQLSFGSIADFTGRKVASIVTVVFTMVGVVASGCMPVNTPLGIGVSLGLCRFIAGIGIGGEWPLSAAITKEASTKQLCLSRETMLVCNMAAFSFGCLVQSLLVFVLCCARVKLDYVWRLAILCGLIPSAFAVYLRSRMHEPEATPQAPTPQGLTPRLPARRGSFGGQEEASRSFDSWKNDLKMVLVPRWQPLLGASLCWALFNFCCYGQSTFASTISHALLKATDEGIYTTLKRDAAFAIISSVSSILGVVISLTLIHRYTLKTQQAVSFAVYAGCIYVVSSQADNSGGWSAASFYFAGVVAQGVIGITTYVLASKFPSSVRTTAIGIAAASGKMGGIVGTSLFPFIKHAYGLGSTLFIAVILAAVAVVTTMVLTPPEMAVDEKEEKEY